MYMYKHIYIYVYIPTILEKDKRYFAHAFKHAWPAKQGKKREKK